MKTAIKSLVAALAVSATVLSPVVVTPAAAENGYSGSWDDINAIPNYHDLRRFPRHHHRDYRHYRRHGNDAAAAAIIGLATGAIIAGALTTRVPQPTYVVPEYRPARPKVITLGSDLEPWTTGWYQWCDARYRSFNPKTGTFRGYDGQDHFCVPN